MAITTGVYLTKRIQTLKEEIEKFSLGNLFNVMFTILQPISFIIRQNSLRQKVTEIGLICEELFLMCIQSTLENSGVNPNIIYR